MLAARRSAVPPAAHTRGSHGEKKSATYFLPAGNVWLSPEAGGHPLCMAPEQWQSGVMKGEVFPPRMDPTSDDGDRLPSVPTPGAAAAPRTSGVPTPVPQGDPEAGKMQQMLLEQQRRRAAASGLLRASSFTSLASTPTAASEEAEEAPAGEEKPGLPPDRSILGGEHFPLAARTRFEQGGATFSPVPELQAHQDIWGLVTGQHGWVGFREDKRRVRLHWVGLWRPPGPQGERALFAAFLQLPGRMGAGVSAREAAEAEPTLLLLDPRLLRQELEGTVPRPLFSVAHSVDVRHRTSINGYIAAATRRLTGKDKQSAAARRMALAKRARERREKERARSRRGRGGRSLSKVMRSAAGGGKGRR